MVNSFPARGLACGRPINIKNMTDSKAKGWSVRVVMPRGDDPRYPVIWYIVAEAEPEAAIEAVRKAITLPGPASIEAVQQMPVVFQGRRLQPGEVAFLYRRGPPRN